MAFPGGAQIAVIRHGPNVPLPAMQLDFLNNTSLNSRVTFSRGTNATLVDSTGKITYAPANLLVRSEEFDNAVWAKAGVAVTANAEVAPDGTTTADRIVSSGGSFPQLAQSASVPAGNFVFSIWVKSDGTSQIAQAIIFDGVTVAFTPTETWQRISGLKTNSTGGSKSLVIATNSGSAPASSYLVWGAQLEAVTYQTTPGTYNATTASAYYGPRFDYDPVTLAPRGLLIEEARTNLLTYSEQFDNAAWTKSATTITPNATISPAGTNNAALAVPSATVANHDIAQVVTAAAVSYTLSVYAKAQSYNFLLLLYFDGVSDRSAYFNLSTGTIGSTATLTTPTITAVGNGWYRCAITFTGVVGRNNFVIGPAPSDGGRAVAGNGTSGIYIWGADLEAGAFATSYIPTVASTVSRSADVATMTGTNFSTWYNQAAGTFVVGMDTLYSNAADSATIRAVFTADDGTLNNLHRIYQYQNRYGANTVVGGANQSDISIGVIAANTPATAAYAYAVNDFAPAMNGILGTPDTSGTLPTPTQLSFGARWAVNGHIRALAYYNTRLPNTSLQTLTAPSLAAPLTLDFLSTTYTVGY